MTGTVRVQVGLVEHIELRSFGDTVRYRKRRHADGNPVRVEPEARVIDPILIIRGIRGGTVKVPVAQRIAGLRDADERRGGGLIEIANRDGDPATAIWIINNLGIERATRVI